MKNNEIVLIGSYCDTQIKLDTLEKQIDSLKLLNLDILVFGRHPLPQHIQKKCDYFIFDKSNPILKDRVLYNYLFTHGKKINFIFQDHGYAALEQITKSLGFVKSLNYDIAYWLVYDVDVTEFSSFRELSLIKLKNHNAVCHNYFPKSTQFSSGIDGTSISFKVQTAYDKLKSTMTETFYRDLIKRKNKDFISEDFMEECFRVSEMNHYIMKPKPNLPAILSNTNNRKHGEVPSSLLKINKYFKRCFIGLNTDINRCVIWIDNILQSFEEISFMINDKEIITKKNIKANDHGGVEIIINKATQLKIISIDGETINELLDPELTEQYWKINNIKNYQI